MFSLKLKLDDLVLLPLALEALFVRTALNIGVGGDIFNASNFSCVYFECELGSVKFQSKIWFVSVSVF